MSSNKYMTDEHRGEQVKEDTRPHAKAERIFKKESRKLKSLDPDETWERIRSGLVGFIKEKNMSLWEFLDKPENKPISDLLESERDELGDKSILAVTRAYLEAEEKAKSLKA